MFKRPEKFTTIGSISPMDKERREWDEREGSKVIQASNWRKMAFSLLIICVALVGGIIYQSMKSQLVPYVVEVDKQTGQVLNAGVIKESNYTPQEAVIKYFVGKFLINSRSIPLDPVVYKEQLKTAYAYLTKDGAAKFDSEMKSTKTIDKFGHKTVQVNITSILPIDDTNAADDGKHYQIHWQEEEFTIGSGDKVVTPMSGIVTVKTIKVDDPKTLDTNPLGLYISDFNFSKDASVVNSKK